MDMKFHFIIAIGVSALIVPIGTQLVLINVVYVKLMISSKCQLKIA